MNLPKCTLLYGMTKKEMKELKDMPYEKAIILKKKKAKELNERLHELNYTERDNYRIKEVSEAIELNQVFLDELI